MGWWSPAGGQLNFLKTYGIERYHPTYMNRRVWRVFSLANPKAELPPDTNSWADDYPFSMKVQKSKEFSLQGE